MEQSSYLDPDSLYIQCQNALEVIEAENEAYANLRLSLQNKVIEATSTSDSVDNYKAYASDLCCVLDKIIEANEIDKADFEEVKLALNTILTDKVDIYENLDGAIILSNIENIQSSIDTCNRMLESLRSDANSNILFGWVLNDQISEWEGKLEGYEKALEEFRYKEQRYDEVENATSGLFVDSIEIRQLAWAALEEIIIIDGEYKPNVDAEWRYKFMQMDIQRDYADLYDYLCGLTDDNGNSIYNEKDVLKFIQDLKNNNIDILNSLVEAKASNTSDYAKQLEDIEAMIEGKVVSPNQQYSDSIRYYKHPNGNLLFISNQHGSRGCSGYNWKEVITVEGDCVDGPGCYLFAGSGALSYISGDSIDLAYLLQCWGYDVDVSNASTITVSPQINTLSNRTFELPLIVDGEKVKNTEWDKIISNATGKNVTQKTYGGSVAGWTYPSDISNVCYIVRQSNSGAGPIDTSGYGHWVCIFPIGDNKYQVINYNGYGGNGQEIITHEQLTGLSAGQYELRWE